MKFLVLCLLLLCGGLGLKAQQVHFIYLQSDNKQPFYVRYNDKIFSSSSTGYLVIPKLRPGEHKLAIGFPKNEWPLQTLIVQVTDKDLGFALKNFEKKGWALFNLQSLEVINGSSLTKTDIVKSGDERTDNFSDVLSNVVNTPSLREQNKETAVVNPPEQKKETAVVNPPEQKETLAPVTAVLEDARPEISVRKISSLSDSEGLVMLYLDEQPSGTDTIRVLIETEPDPVVAAVAPQTETPQKTNQPEATVKQNPPPAQEDSKTDPKFLSIEVVNPNATEIKVEKVELQKAPIKPESGTVNATPLMINSDCKQLATDEDFLKIRKKMSSEKNDEKMVSAAVKMFRQKCFSTDQIRNLSVLFLKDEEKYRFFDAAYPHVHDSRNFKLLESQLTDPYTITRFRAMLRN